MNEKLASLTTCAYQLIAPIAIDALPEPRRPTRALPASIELADDGKAPDALVLVGIEEGVIIPERHAAVGLTGAAEHVGMREQAVAAKNLVLAADRIEPQRRHAVEQRLARREIVDVRRRHALHPHM